MPPINLVKIEPDRVLEFIKSASAAPPAVRTLKLTNITQGPVAFKVKTTAPKSYLVRPSTKTLAPGESEEVNISLQLQGGDTNYASHRFLVQAATVASDAAVSREQWTEMPKDQVQENRLSVVVSEAGAPAATSGARAVGGLDAGKAAAGESPTDLKVKYDELVHYTLMLEQKKRKLEDDVKDLQKSPAGSSKGAGGFSKWHLVLAVLFGFLLFYASKFVPEAF